MANKELYKEAIAAASKAIKADIVIKNGKIIDVFNREIIEDEDIAIHNGKFVGIGSYDGETIIDAKGSYISPTFIDGHVHIESSMVTPLELAKVLIPKGVTTIIADPHEIANVCGIEGIKYMLAASLNSPLSIYFMLPSSVPATEFEHAGAELLAGDLSPFYNDSQVIGLAEVMDYPAVINRDEQMIEKLLSAKSYQKLIDGHCAGLDKYGLNSYMTAGIKTDHEAISIKEAKERLQRGMYLMIREGSVAKDLKNLLGAITNNNAHRCLFVTDDKHLDDLLEEGSIDYHVRTAISEGIDPLIAYSIATIHAAQCFHLFHKGAIAPGYDADFMFIEDLEQVKITHVFQKGKIATKNGELVPLKREEYQPNPTLLKTMNIKHLTKEDIILTVKSQAHIIEIIPNSLVTNHLIEEVDSNNDVFIPNIKRDLLKLAVIERHHQTGNVGLAILKGMKIKEGAIASTVAHDSHNLIVCSTNDDDLLFAVDKINEINGGIIVVRDRKVLASLPLPIAGLLSTEPYQVVNEKLQLLNSSLKDIGFTGNFNPFLTLSFLALPVIPSLKLTDSGLFDVNNFTHIE